MSFTKSIGSPKTKKVVYRVGDKVKIVKPEVFVRVGYPLTKEIVKNTLIIAEEKAKIWKLLGCCSDDLSLMYYEDLDAVQIFEEIIDRLAYYKLKKANFGGKERKIYTEFRPEHQEKIMVINSKRFVKTGIYNSGYFNREDYEPPYLTNEKTHVILSLICDDCYIEPIEIEEINVIKYETRITEI